MNGYTNSDVIIGKGNNLLIALGWLSSVLALFIYPFIFGVIGVVMGILGSKSGNRAGVALITVSIIFMACGLIFSEFLSGLARSFIGR
jgi:hypothetical protein